MKKTTIASYVTLTLLSLALCGTPAAAAGRTGCLMFCNQEPAPAAAPKAQTPVDPQAPVDLDGAIVQAQAARKAGNLMGATRILSQLVLFAPDDPRVLGEYGKTLAAQGKSEDALAFLDRAIQLTPSEWTLYSAQGVAYDQKGAYKAAQESYSRALSLKPGEPTVLNNAALSHMQSGDLESAKALLEEASPSAREFPRIADNLALVQHLIASRPAAPAAPVPAALPSTPPAPPAKVAALPGPVPDVEPAKVAEAPAALPTPVADAMPAVAMPPVETAALDAPKSEPKPQTKPEEPVQTASPALAALQADPTVRMAPVPKETIAAPAGPRPLTVPKPAAAPEPAKRQQVASLSPKTPGRSSTYYVQAGAYATEERAGRQAQTLDALGARVSQATIDGHSVYRVRIGPFLDVEQAKFAASQAQSMGHPDLKIVSDQ